MKELITIKQGDLFENLPKNGNVIIAHICNNVSAWGAGFVIAINQNLGLRAKQAFLNMQQILGNVEIVHIEDNIYVANMISQDGIFPKNGRIPFRYKIFRKCLIKLNEEAKKLNAEVYMPKVGSGLAGGNWNIILDHIESDMEVKTTIFYFE